MVIQSELPWKHGEVHKRTAQSNDLCEQQLNAFKESRSKFLSNPEVAAIISLVGGGYGRDFDISKVKWDKVIAFADADADKQWELSAAVEILQK